MPKHDVKFEAVKMAQQVKHYLITLLGKTVDESTEEEFYRALSWVLREQVMINWTATMHSHAKHQARKTYYISMEWLPGRLFVNNVTNIGSIDLVKQVFKELGRDYQRIINTEPDPGLGNGGLGRLAACFLDSLATQHYPAMGYGLRYQYGIFEQEVWSGVQIERPDCWLLNEFPWEMRRDSHAIQVLYGGRVIEDRNKHNELIHRLIDYEEVRALPYDLPVVGYSNGADYSALTLRLWTTKESPRNFQLARYNEGSLSEAAERTALTDVLYANDNNPFGRSVRLKQEYLLVSAALQDIIKQYMMTFPDFSQFGDKVRIQINDTHPALVIAELMRMLTKRHEHSWAEAWDITKSVCSYTNHTVLKESLEEWESSLMKQLLPRQYHIIEKLNFDFCNQVRSKFPNDEERIKRMSIIEDDRVRMANLAIVGSHKVNGVAALHSEILKEKIFKDFDQMFPDKFINVTNGVTQRRWLLMSNPRLAALITKLIGKEWIVDLPQLEKLADFAKDPNVQKQFLEIKKDNKERLIKALSKYNMARYGNKECLKHDFFPDVDAIFDMQIKRIHEYKRQLMNALHLIMIYQELKENPSARTIKRMAIIGGKAAAGYVVAKNVIRLIYCLSRKINKDPVVGKLLKIVFVENYNVTKAELLIPAADLSEQISTAGQEASGTGNMKFSLNGALTIGTDDGANIEMKESITEKWWPFGFGASAEENEKQTFEGSYNPEKYLRDNPAVRNAVEALRDGSLVDNDVENQILTSLYNNLMVGTGRDRYFVLKDLGDYFDTQKKVEELYQDQSKWAEYCIHNIAAMGRFSSDESIKNYAEKIWGLEKCFIDKEELARVRKEFLESDRCYIA